jgi:hypothetical protein
MLRRRNKFPEDGYNFPLCLNGLEETMEDLFFDYPFAVLLVFSGMRTPVSITKFFLLSNSSINFFYGNLHDRCPGCLE